MRGPLALLFSVETWKLFYATMLGAFGCILSHIELVRHCFLRARRRLYFICDVSTDFDSITPNWIGICLEQLAWGCSCPSCRNCIKFTFWKIDRRSRFDTSLIRLSLRDLEYWRVLITGIYGALSSSKSPARRGKPLERNGNLRSSFLLFLLTSMTITTVMEFLVS